MALSISYFDGEDKQTKVCYGKLIASVSYTVTGSSASCGAIPEGAKIARCKAGEATVLSNNGTAAATTNGVHLAADEVIDLAIFGTTALLAKTA